MRDLKFKAWDKNKKIWYNLVCASMGDNVACSIVYNKEKQDWVNFDKFCGDIVQYTGLKDKNGKEICEGDVLLIVEKIKCKVVWNTEKASFCVNNLEEESEHLFGAHLTEIIGNIYENPELI